MAIFFFGCNKSRKKILNSIYNHELPRIMQKKDIHRLTFDNLLFVLYIPAFEICKLLFLCYNLSICGSKFVCLNTYFNNDSNVESRYGIHNNYGKTWELVNTPCCKTSYSPLYMKINYKNSYHARSYKSEIAMLS